jgi:mycofactocin precursor
MCDSFVMTLTIQSLTLPAPPVVDPRDAAVAEISPGELLVEESLVEEVSIDGMCGVY